MDKNKRFILPIFSLGYPLVCDSQMKEPPPSFPENDKEASQLEQEYVHRVYEEIAGHFSSTRHTPWPRIVEFLKALPRGSLVAEIGCGNGKYLGINKELYMASNCCFWLSFYNTLFIRVLSPSSSWYDGVFFRLQKNYNQQIEN